MKSLMFLVIIIFISINLYALERNDPLQYKERTSFHEQAAYQTTTDIKADIAIVYGFYDCETRIQKWLERGYITQFVSGASWGYYQDFLDQNPENGQIDKNGTPILHPINVQYVVPSSNFSKYLFERLKNAIDAGASAVYLEEPEYWSQAGYSKEFKTAWKNYYNTEWIPLYSSVDAQYKASKLKYHLLRKELEETFLLVKDYSKQINKNIKCYVPTHSLMHYTRSCIVSPEATLIDIDACDGYIGQVWTGTSRIPNYYNGVLKERTFETAFCEYGVLNNLVRATDKRMWFLNDPVEDILSFCWEDYRMNWESTLVASLLWTDVFRYELMPYPDRVLNWAFPIKNLRDLKEGEDPNSIPKETIPKSYSSELMSVSMELNNLDQEYIKWDCGTQGIGVFVSDSYMFQRGEPVYSDAYLGFFYGISLPLIKKGVPVAPVQLENVGIKDYLKPYKVIFLTYEGMKPLEEKYHTYIAEWVKSGGVLIIIDDDSDPYNSVSEWWNSGKYSYSTPRLHLFDALNITNSEERHALGKGFVIYKKQSPSALTYKENGSETIIDLGKEACKSIKQPWKETNYMILRRGEYVIASGLDETKDMTIKTISGTFIDLFDDKLNIKNKIEIAPSSRIFLKDISKYKSPAILASSSKILNIKHNKNQISFTTEGPDKTIGNTRILLPQEPKTITNSLDIKTEQIWDNESKTLLLRYENEIDPFTIYVNW